MNRKTMIATTLVLSVLAGCSYAWKQPASSTSFASMGLAYPVGDVEGTAWGWFAFGGHRSEGTAEAEMYERAVELGATEVVDLEYESNCAWWLLGAGVGAALSIAGAFMQTSDTDAVATTGFALNLLAPVATLAIPTCSTTVRGTAVRHNAPAAAPAATW